MAAHRGHQPPPRITIKLLRLLVIHVDYSKHVISGMIQIFLFYSADLENASRSYKTRIMTQPAFLQPSSAGLLSDPAAQNLGGHCVTCPP